MKRNSIFSGRMVACAAALAVLGLSSCQSALYKAAERGDVGAVQQALAGGATVKDKNEAADVAYKKGHTAVLEELGKSGVGVAHDTMTGKVLVLQTNKMGETNTQECNAPDAMHSPDSISPMSYWKPVSWKSPAQDDYCRLRELSWADNRPNKFEYETREGEGSSYNTQSYTRIGRNTAVACDSSSLMMDGASSSLGRRWFKYELTFETPTTGTFCGYDGEKYCNVNQLMGRFWVKEAAAPAAPAPKASKQATKKKTARKKRRK